MFRLESKYKPTGDQPSAIKTLLAGLKKNYRDQTLIGVTGSGKTFTMANIIAKTQKPTLIISHNKTLAAQLYSEFKQFFPTNAIHYFVSYYDYYQPEAYIPQSDTYIEKESTINEEIDRLRHSTTQSLINRRDVIIVASVSCIYGIGAREDYANLGVNFKKGQKIKRNAILRQLIRIHYERNDTAFCRGQFKVKGDTIDINLATGEQILRIMMWGNIIDKILIFNIKPSTNKPAWMFNFKNKEAVELKNINILPARHFIVKDNTMKIAITKIRQELKARLKILHKEKKMIEAYRLTRKTNYDLEMISEIGYCNGIENYSLHMSNRLPGSPPSTLIDFFPEDFLLFIDESHVTLPQIRGMYAGDKARKETLINFGFRLPSAKDNRPLNFEEFDKKIKQVIYVSATPQEYETEKSKMIAEQIIRPTGLLDPKIEVRSNKGQIDDLIKEIKATVKKRQRVLVTVLTKRMAEELTEYLVERKIKVQYLHSEIDTLQRVDILKDLRIGTYDCLVGINLLREGLDLPEVSLVAIVDADIGGFLRHKTALMQTVGRAARHSEGRVIMYGDKITPAMKATISETERRRKIQTAYNKKHSIIPKTIKAKFHDNII